MNAAKAEKADDFLRRLASKFQKQLDIKTYLEFFGTKWKKPHFVVNIGEECYTDNTSVVLGLKHQTFEWCDSNEDFWETADYVRGHELQHIKSTTQKSWLYGLDRGQKVIIEHLVDKNKIPVRLITDASYNTALEKLREQGYRININALQHIVHFVMNSLEDGRIEAIRAENNNSFKAQMIHIRLLTWGLTPFSFKDLRKPPKTTVDDLNASQKLSIVLNQILSLSTSSVYQKGFAENFFGTEIQDRVCEVIPNIAKAVTAKRCRECMQEGIKICEKLADLIAEASLVPDFEDLIKLILEQILKADSFEPTGNEKDEEQGSGKSSSPFGHTDLYIELEDEEYDKLMEKADEEEENDDDNGGLRLHIKRKHPLPDEESKKKKENDKESGMSSGSGEGNSDDEDGNGTGSNKSSSQPKDGDESSDTKGSNGSGTEPSEDSKNEDGSGSGSGKNSNEDSSDSANSGSSDDSGEGDSEKENNEGKGNGKGEDGEQHSGSAGDASDSNNESGKQGPESNDNNKSSTGKGKEKTGHGGDVNEADTGKGDDAPDVSAAEKAIEEQMKKAAEAAAGCSKDAVDAMDAMEKRSEKKQSLKADVKEPIKPTDISGINEQYPYEVRLVEKERAYEVDEMMPYDLEAEAETFAKKIEQYMHDKKKKYRKFINSGKLDSSRVAMLGANCIDVFKETKISKGASACAEIIVDNSGSMGYGDDSKRFYACRALAKIEMAFGKYFPLKIFAFDATGVQCVVHEIIKNWNERFARSASYNFLIKGRYGSGNKDGYSIRVATKDLLTRPEKRKLLVVMSDGAPSDYRGNGYNDVRAAVEEARRAGIIVVGIFFSYEGDEYGRKVFADMYQKDYITTTVDMIDEELARIMKMFFI